MTSTNAKGEAKKKPHNSNTHVRFIAFLLPRSTSTFVILLVYESYFFLEIKLVERAELLWEKATFVTTASQFNHHINLYYLNGDFVEVWYDIAKNKITKITPMKSIRLFKGYFKWNKKP